MSTYRNQSQHINFFSQAEPASAADYAEDQKRGAGLGGPLAWHSGAFSNQNLNRDSFQMALRLDLSYGGSRLFDKQFVG